MSEMKFKRILIGDIQKKTAKTAVFNDGINIITSSDNHVGKSSLVKSLYYALGAEVEYDDIWDKKSKIYIVDFEINKDVYKIARFGRKFAVLKNGVIELIIKSDRERLSSYLESIFNFSVYLPNKNTGEIELAPPVFTYLPYYIDQDKGWSNEPYESFLSLNQYKKNDRKTSLYYHLNVYNKSYVDMLSKIDKNKTLISEYDQKITEFKSTLSMLERESSYIIEANDIKEFDDSFVFTKQNLQEIINKVTKSRDIIQKFESERLKYEEQLDIINKFNKIKAKNVENIQLENTPSCPQCGYVMTDEIYDLVQKQYSIANEAFIIQQIQLLIDDISKKIDIEKNNYLKLIKNLKDEESKISEIEDDFQLYTKYKGLISTIKNLEKQMYSIYSDKLDLETVNKELDKKQKKMVDKKEAGKIYADNLTSDLIALEAWNNSYDLKILKPIKAQGTLSTKIILAQHIALFRTIEQTAPDKTIRLPFIVDSPRTKEASRASSKDILKLILGTNILSQIILVTLDFEEFMPETKESINVITLTEEKKLLNYHEYDNNKEELQDLYSLLEHGI